MIIDELYQRYLHGKFHNSWIISSLDLDNTLNDLLDFSSKNLLQNVAQIDLTIHPDFYLVSKDTNAKNISIEQLREAQKFLYKTSGISSNKILILYQAELMSISAMNSCLKILEDPPSNAYIFLLTSFPSLLPSTIKSRCLKLDKMIPIPAKIGLDSTREVANIYLQAVIEKDFQFEMKILKSYAEKDRESWKKEVNHFLDTMIKILNKSAKIDIEMNTLEIKLYNKIKHIPHLILAKTLENMNKLVSNTIQYDLDLRASSILLINLIIKLSQYV
jgi:DNA polymerase-3 subunit delta'